MSIRELKRMLKEKRPAKRRKSRSIVIDFANQRITLSGIYRTYEPRAGVLSEISPGVRLTNVDTPDELTALEELWADSRYASISSAAPLLLAPLLAAEKILEPFRSDGKYTIPEDAPPEVHDAVSLLSQIERVQSTDDPDLKALRAFEVGRLYERLLVRGVEARALPVCRRTAAGVAERTKRKASEHEEYCDAVAEHLEEQKSVGTRKPSLTRAYDAVAELFEVDPRTVANAWRDHRRGSAGR